MKRNSGLFLKNATVLLKSGFARGLNIEVRDGAIKDIFTGACSSDAIDCRGFLLVPGLIDLHVHFRDPGYTYKEDIETGAESAAAGGFTTVVMQPNTNPVIDNKLVANYLNSQCREAKINIKYYSAATKSSSGQEIVAVQSMLSVGAVGFTDDGLPIANAKVMKTLLEYSQKFGFPVAQHAEDLNLSNCGCVHAGSFSKRFSLAEIDPAAEYTNIARDLALLEELPNARYHVLHVSTAKSVEYIRLAKQKGLNVTCEVTPHHFSLTNEVLNKFYTNAKMNPPLRSICDVNAILGGMKDGTIDIIASDHAPHDAESKEKPISCAAFGIIGLESMLPLSLELYHKKILTLERVFEMLSVLPAKFLRDEKRGEIKIGNIADLALIDINREWLLSTETIKSKSRNTPLEGMMMRGKCIMTICNGKIIHQEYPLI